MKRLITRWTCDRCGAENEETGDKPRPLGWRRNVLDLHHVKRDATLCNDCVRALEAWLDVGIEEAADA